MLSDTMKMRRYRPQLFVDLDGVLADFDKQFEVLFGHRPDRSKGDIPNMWERMEKDDFFLKLDPMPDWEKLWNHCEQYDPIILTGAPKELHFIGQHKRQWVRKIIGNVPIIVCPSRAKYYNADPGDILIDDWEKYMHLWKHVGGHWITHTSADSSIEQLELHLSQNTEIVNDR